MTETIHIHPDNPQPRLLATVVTLLRKDAVIVYPTGSGYALACQLGSKRGIEQIHRIREFDKNHFFTLMCSDLSEISEYAKVSNANFRLLKANTPGGFTFILPASNGVPKKLQHPKRKTIGIQVPDNKIAHLIVAELNAPLMSVSLKMRGFDESPRDFDECEEQIHDGTVDLMIDGGYAGVESTTLVDLTGDSPEIIREGRGGLV